MAIRRKGDKTVSGAADGTALGVWEDAPTEFTRRCVFMTVYGETGSGRTTFALTAPGPIGLAHTAEKIDGIVQQFSKDKKVRIVNFGGTFRGSREEIAEAGSKVWERMKVGWYDGIDNWARTVVMDTDSEAWEMLRIARLGTANPQNPSPHIWGPINKEWRDLFKYYRRQDYCSVVSIGMLKDEYENKIIQGKEVSKATGRRIRAGQKEMSYMSDVIVRTVKKVVDGESMFSVVVEKAWWNASVEGMVFEGDECRFSYVMSLITETDEAEWQ